MYQQKYLSRAMAFIAPAFLSVAISGVQAQTVDNAFIEAYNAAQSTLASTQQSFWIDPYQTQMIVSKKADSKVEYFFKIKMYAAVATNKPCPSGAGISWLLIGLSDDTDTLYAPFDQNINHQWRREYISLAGSSTPVRTALCTVTVISLPINDEYVSFFEPLGPVVRAAHQSVLNYAAGIPSDNDDITIGLRNISDIIQSNIDILSFAAIGGPGTFKPSIFARQSRSLSGGGLVGSWPLDKWGHPIAPKPGLTGIFTTPPATWRVHSRVDGTND